MTTRYLANDNKPARYVSIRFQRDSSPYDESKLAIYQGNGGENGRNRRRYQKSSGGGQIELWYVLGDDAFGRQSAQQYQLFEELPRSLTISRSSNALFLAGADRVPRKQKPC